MRMVISVTSNGRHLEYLGGIALVVMDALAQNNIGIIFFWVWFVTCNVKVTAIL